MTHSASCLIYLCTCTPRDTPMIEVAITPEMIEKARNLADEVGKLKNSITEGHGTFVGFLGEECYLKAFPEAVRSNTYNHDIEHNGYRVEVKTKGRKVVPKPFYEATVQAFNARQNAHFYAFVSLLQNNRFEYTKGYLCGYMRCREYKEKARLIPAGYNDSSNNLTFKADCYNLEYKDLNQFTPKIVLS